MASPANRFSQMQKIAVFLLVIGPEKAREILADLDFDTIEQINRSLAELGPVSPQERAAVVVEFGELFFKGVPLAGTVGEPAEPPPGGDQPGNPPPASRATADAPACGRHDASTSPPRPDGDATSAQHPPQVPPPGPQNAARTALDHLKRRIDPGKIDWGRAGYDFGEGFRGGTDEPAR